MRNKEKWETWCRDNELTPLQEYSNTQIKYLYRFNTGEFKGCEGKAYWSSICKNIKPMYRSLTKKGVKQYMYLLGKRKGLRIISVISKSGTKTQLLYIVTKGKYKGSRGLTNMDNLRKMKRIDLRSLTTEGKKYFFNKVANGRGYTIIKYPNELFARNKCILKSPLGNEWEVSWNSFEQDRKLNCPKDNALSYGESCIRDILIDNNIDFQIEKLIKTKSEKTQRLDFYFTIGDKKYAIEYNGKQHYIQSTGYWTTSIEKIKFRDKCKKEYCIDNNISLIIIPYTKDTKKMIFKELSNNIPSINVYKDYEVSKYYRWVDNFKKK